MYTVSQNPFNIFNFHVFLHENCPLSIHQVAQNVLSDLKTTMGPGEYIVRSDNVAEIAIYH